ncbi:MAG: NYN domain-containing protein [Hyphomicrobium sp.]|uniref:NYN domain-containing protein n=1 Tax=Hyphomicrobium sp. TaxID=82 RepID=UPI001320ACD3|nr:NYN domain-containing protein [Hyphomicrobium sp.]KAB2940438.1 MAG: NYN domain-containing protein [Hyphomicrobium sp.]MBZ0208271.1 NYN domain-containing protein [Hyphomicrobium sp.]
MKRESSGPILTTVFVDYDNVYLSLKRKSEEAAKRFSKDAGLWLKEIATGALMTPTNAPAIETERRIVINRCYGNPVPRRNQSDNSTDMSSFPFVRHHFLRAGFEVVDCPPLTAQLKNSADIRMVMDVRDILTHDTRFDEFVILSGDADFTPVLHRLRSHARRTVIYSNDHTAAPYTAICDAEIREADFLALLIDGQLTNQSQRGEPQALPSAASIEAVRNEILTEVANAVRAADQPMPLEALADRCVRVLGHEKTVGGAWGGTGSFRDLLARGLPEDIRLTAQPPYFVYDANRAAQSEAPRIETRIETQMQPRVDPRADIARPEPTRAEAPLQRALAPLFGAQPAQRPVAAQTGAPAPAQRGPLAPAQPETLSGQPGLPRQQPAGAQRTAQGAAAIQQSIARIHEASQAPTLSPQDYRTLFDVMAQEIAANGLAGQQTLINIVKRAENVGIDIRRDDVRFVLDVVSEADPWFDQGASPSLFASRFRNFVMARCRGQGLSLSADELDLIEAWFAAPVPQRAAAAAQGGYTPSRQPQLLGVGPDAAQNEGVRADRWWSLDEGRQPASEQATGTGGDEFPRIIRTRLRG